MEEDWGLGKEVWVAGENFLYSVIDRVKNEKWKATKGSFPN